jgi:hypothetical protein
VKRADTFSEFRDKIRQWEQKKYGISFGSDIQ